MFKNPKTITVGDRDYDIRTDFRTWIKFGMLVSDERVHNKYKMPLLLQLAFYDPPSELNTEAYKATMLFYACGVTPDDRGGDGNKNRDIIYDFRIDHQRIKAAFISEFGFNPFDKDYWHWWDFKACFDHLLGASFKNAVDWRSVDLSEYKGKQHMKMLEGKMRHKIPTKADIKQKHEAKKAEQAYKSGNLKEYVLKYQEEMKNGKI
ncbi:MAG: bacteriophage Gp15 family protein [Clostridiales bacterium]|jgi:hypothetical protein|nr:bacteriophage Gp15 family protein [Clostridiales bacterium]